jgi:hypothetical protein
MAKLKPTVSITAQDLKKLSLEQADRHGDHKRLQKFLDDTNTGVDLDRVSERELEQIRAVVDNPAAALSGPSILLWNNIRRQRSGLSHRPR